jgi:predicted DNA binding CopG/RHH family protein
MKKKLKVPKFKNEEEEFKFWAGLDVSAYFEPSDFKSFDLDDFLTKQAKPKTKRITMRLPEVLISKVKSQARELDVPYQSLMKQYIQKGASA